MKTYTTEELVSELRTIGTEMRTWEEQGKSPDISEPTGRLQVAATQVAMAWSGSNLGYQSRVSSIAGSLHRCDILSPPGDVEANHGSLHQRQGGSTYTLQEGLPDIYAGLHHTAFVTIYEVVFIWTREDRVRHRSADTGNNRK